MPTPEEKRSAQIESLRERVKRAEQDIRDLKDHSTLGVKECLTILIGALIAILVALFGRG